jgi:homoserine kinase
MTLEKTKTLNLNFSSSQLLKMLLLVLPIVAGGAYAGITFYNKMVTAIEAVDSLDLAPIESKINGLEIQVKAISERQYQLSESIMKASEKSSDAIANSRETAAMVSGLRKELEATVNAMDDKLNTVKRSTMNPLSK